MLLQMEMLFVHTVETAINTVYINSYFKCFYFSVAEPIRKITDFAILVLRCS